MMTALMVFFGVSGCSTLLILTAVVLGARRPVPSYEPAEFDSTVCASGTKGSASGGKFSPAYNH